MEKRALSSSFSKVFFVLKNSFMLPSSRAKRKVKWLWTKAGTVLRNPVFMLVWGHSSMNWKVLEHGGVLLPSVLFLFCFFFRFIFFLRPCKYRVSSHSWQPCCPFKTLYPPLPFSSFLCFLFFLIPYKMGASSFFRW